MANRSEKRVLFVAFHYPPDLSSSGVLRTLKFTRYLPDHGWKPTVLSVREECYEHTDAKLLEQIPSEVEVKRTWALDTKKAFSIRGKYLRITTVPDRFIGWLPFAVLAGLRVIRRKQIQVLYSTSPLATSHLIALTLKFFTGLPWVADFRDPWVEPDIAPDPKSLLFRLECYLERRVVRRADRIVFTTAQLRDDVLRRHPGVAPERAVVIPNGYDEDDFQSIEAQPNGTMPVRIMHAGLVDEFYRSPRTFLEALTGLLRRGALKREDIRVDFLGGGSYVHSAGFRSLLDELDLGDVVSVLPRVSYSESLDQQSRSHVLLLLQCGEDTRTLIPAKAFEYLRIGRPILALVPRSASSELFERVGGARIAHPMDIAAIQVAILELFSAVRTGCWKSDVDLLVLQSFARRKLSARLAEELDSLWEGVLTA